MRAEPELLRQFQKTVKAGFMQYIRNARCVKYVVASVVELCLIAWLLLCAVWRNGACVCLVAQCDGFSGFWLLAPSGSIGEVLLQACRYHRASAAVSW